MNITEIPFELPGKLFRGTMPYEITTKPKILTESQNASYPANCLTLPP